MDRDSWAVAAYRHAKFILVIGAGNNPERVEETGGWSKTSVEAMRYGHDWVRKDTVWTLVTKSATARTWSPTTGQGISDHTSILSIAKRATEYRAGNCGENQAVVYKFLLDKARQVGVGWVSAVTCIDVDHDFVVIGTKAPPEHPQCRSKRADWEADDIVIDPWCGVVGTAWKIGNPFCKESHLLVCERPQSIVDSRKYITKSRVGTLSSFNADGG